jgi:DHA1 family bicyclomycin/chloramphenicol resistance-like MFS transporter
MRQILLLAAAIAVGQFANSMILPALPLLARDLGMPASRAGLVVTAYFAGFAAIGLVVGPLSDRFGRRPLLLGGSVVLALGSLACAFATSFSVLLGCRLLEAAGAGGTPAVSRAIVRDTRHGSDLAVALGLLATIMSVSPVVGPILGGLAAEAVGWRGLFGILSLLGLLAAIGVYAGIDETRTPTTTTKGAAMTIRQMRMLLAGQSFRRGVLFGAAFYFAFGAIYTNAPFVLIDHFGLSHRQFGGAFAVLSAFLAVGGLLGPRLMHTALQLKLLPAAAILCITAGFLLFAFIVAGAEDVGALVFCLALFGLSFGLALSIGSAATLSDVGQAAGTASSLSGFMQVGSAALGSAGINVLHDGSGMPIAAILVFTGLAAACTIPHLSGAPSSDGPPPITKQ